MVQVAAEDLLAVAVVVDRVQHVRVPDLVDVRRRHDLGGGVVAAEGEEAPVLLERGGETLVVPVRVPREHELLDAGRVELCELHGRTFPITGLRDGIHL